MSETPKQQGIKLPPWLVWIGSQIWDNGLGWLLTKYGLPLLAMLFVVLSAMMQHWALPYVAMAGVAAFSVAAWGAASLEQRRYLVVAREHLTRGGGVASLVLPAAKVLKAGPPPRVAAEPYDGAKGIVLVRNEGGDGIFTARAKIVAVEKVGINHTAPYFMIWRNVETHLEEKGHKVLIRANGESKLLVSTARWHGNHRNIIINGDSGMVDNYSATYGSKTPQITVEIEITSEPPLAQPYKEQFITVSPAGDELTALVRRPKASHGATN